MAKKSIRPLVKLGWFVPVSVKDGFTDFCVNKGVKIQEDCAGALIIWQYIPAEIREAAKAEAKGCPSVDAVFWTDLCKGLEFGIATQANIRRQKQAKKK